MRGREFAKLVTNHVFCHEYRNELTSVVHGIVKPTKSGVIVLARDQVLMTDFSRGLHRFNALCKLVVDEWGFFE